MRRIALSVCDQLLLLSNNTSVPDGAIAQFQQKKKQKNYETMGSPMDSHTLFMVFE